MWLPFLVFWIMVAVLAIPVLFLAAFDIWFIFTWVVSRKLPADRTYDPVSGKAHGFSRGMKANHRTVIIY